MYRPETTKGQRAALLDVILARLPRYLSDSLRGVLGDLEQAEAHLQTESKMAPPPEVQPCLPWKREERNIDGLKDHSRDIWYIGKAYKGIDGRWSCLADVNGMLCLVEVTIRETKDEPATGDDG